MREISASEASRNFSAVLNSAEHGETTVVTRGGRSVAMIVPAPRANGEALRELFARWREHPALDDAFEANIAEARETANARQDSDPWHD